MWTFWGKVMIYSPHAQMVVHLMLPWLWASGSGSGVEEGKIQGRNVKNAA